MGFIVGALLLFAFESIKRLVTNNTILTYYRKGVFSWLGGLAVIAFLTASVASSYFGTPILVREFAPMPAEVNEDAIKSRFDSLKSAAVTYWGAVKSDMQAKAKDVHSKNNWKGVTTRDARNTQLSFESKAAAAQDSLNKALAVLASQEGSVLSEYKDKYKADLTQAKSERDLVGGWFAIVTLIFELLFIGCFLFLNHYDFHEACELGLLEANNTFESTKSERKSTTKPIKVEEQKPHQRPANGIGFHNEGGIIDGKILCKKANGELKAYSKSQLSTLAGDAERKGNEDRAKYWIEKRTKLENHINRNA